MTKVNSVIDKVLNFFETYVCCILFFITCSVLLIQVIFRATGLPVSWTEELARYLNVWVIYLAASRAVKISKHMSVEILPLMLKGRAKFILAIFSNAMTLLFFLLLVYFGANVLNGMLTRTQFSAANHINMIIPYAAPVVGSVMMTIRELQIIGKLVKDYMGPKPETGEVAE